MASQHRSRVLLPILPSLLALSSCLALLAAAMAAPLAAQVTPADSLSDSLRAASIVLEPVPVSDAAPTTRLVAGGSLGSVLGIVGGVGVGLGVAAAGACRSGDSGCADGWAMLGMVVGSVVGSATGARLAISPARARPTLGASVKGGLIGLVPGFLGGALLGAVNPWLGVAGYALIQGTVAGQYADGHRLR